MIARCSSLAALAFAGLIAVACSPDGETQTDASAPQAAAPEAAAPAAEAPSWTERFADDMAILRVNAEAEIPDVPATAQAAARISHVADEVSLAGGDEARVAAADAFEHEAVSLAVIAPRTYEAADLKTLIADFIVKAEAFEQEWLVEDAAAP